MNFSNTKVLVIGDVMLDRYVQGSVNRISPEAPIPVLKHTDTITKLGGAANVAQNLRDLGCEVMLCSVIGDDSAGEELAKLLAKSGIVGKLVVQKARPTTVKTRFMADGHQMLRLDDETTDTISSESEQSLWREFIPLTKEVDAVVLSDYSKGVLTDTIISMATTFTEGKPVVVDPKRASFRSYAGATVITPNEKEFWTAFPCYWGNNINNMLAMLRTSEIGSTSVLVTQSEKGMTLFEQKDNQFVEPFHVDAHAKAVVDVCGAGDTVVSTLTACLAIGMSLQEATMKANLAASIVVGKLGVASVTAQELRGASHEITDHVTREAAVDIIASWRSRGFTIGFTNGCYDLVHPGHVRMLRKCRDECDRLVVGLNSDASVRRLKGDSRPVQNEEARAAVLSGLSAVDLVVIFDEDTPRELIETLSPDVLMKGADYTVDKVIGADHVLAAGGEVKLIPLEEGHSTSSLIRKMNGPKKEQ